jgi:lactoylglutathione lyase
VRLTHVRLLVEDYAACFAFYRDVLEFKPTFGDESGPYADFDAGSDVALAIFESKHQIAAKRNGGDHALLILRVDDLDTRVEQLRAGGIGIAGEPQDKPEWGIRVAYIRDPEGNLIELNHPIPAGE